MNNTRSMGIRTITASRIAGIGVFLIPGSPALAQLIIDAEPNDTIATAQVLPLFSDFLVTVVHGSISPGDVDFFQISFPVDAVMDFAIQPPFPEDPPPHVLGVFDSMGTQISPSFFYPQGTYFFGLSGLADIGFSGAHDEEFSYVLGFSYSLFPAPPGFLLFGLAALCGPRRRR